MASGNLVTALLNQSGSVTKVYGGCSGNFICVSSILINSSYWSVVKLYQRTGKVFVMVLNLNVINY